MKSYPSPVLMRYVAVGSTAASLLALEVQPSLAAGGTVPTDVQTGIDNSTATAQALSPLALACLTVALVPWASMLTLRFINMVLSRV